MDYLNSLVAALESVTDRLALHVEYEKYEDTRENNIDKLALADAESMLFNARHPIGIKVLLAMTNLIEIKRVLKNATERLRLHTVLHAYDDMPDELGITEDAADASALDDANSALLNSGENNII